ncbi:hypothetical protein ACFVWR_18555 [Leifsonia sp. NPDC058292]|uniref:hypothetical protein n=1 Tax=Leifsonia sp. NPDC058292 TaxID=3346428 RepID=UPI0036DF1DE7
MSVLRIDAALLDDVASKITTSIPSVRFAPELTSADDSHTGAAEVSTAIREAATMQKLRADVTADALLAVGNSPRGVVSTFSDADAALARAF